MVKKTDGSNRHVIQNDIELDRRTFIKGALAVGALSTGVAAAACTSPTSNEGGETGGTGTQTGSEWGSFDEEGVFTPSFLVEPEPIDDSLIVEEYEADVVVIGLGIAGVCAARSALENGASVFAIEKGDTYHLHSYQISAVNSTIAKETGAAFSDEMVRDLYLEETKTIRQRTNSLLWRHMIYNSGEDFDWYLEKCPNYTYLDSRETEYNPDIDYEAIPMAFEGNLAAIIGRQFPEVTQERIDKVFENGPIINIHNQPFNPRWNYKTERWPQFPATMEIFPTQGDVGKWSAQYVEENASVKYACWAKRLLKGSDGRVNGVIYADIDDKYYKVNAKKGVIMSTGSFGGNKAMTDYFARTGNLFNDNGWPDVDARGNSTDLGEGIAMAAWIGAGIDEADTFAITPDSFGGSLGCDAFLLVDGLGNRFMNEDATGEIQGNKFPRIAGKKMFQIFDHNYPDQVADMPIGHRMYWKIVDNYDEIPPTLFIAAIGMLTRTEVENMTGFICDTIEEAADKIGVPAENLRATIERYNELANKGVDEDFGKRADRLFPVRQSPFYVTEVPPPNNRIWTGGIKVDEQMHALDTDNKPMKGLYVAGQVVGNRFYNYYPSTLMGQNNASGIVFGRLAGKNAANDA